MAKLTADVSRHAPGAVRLAMTNQTASNENTASTATAIMLLHPNSKKLLTHSLTHHISLESKDNAGAKAGAWHPLGNDGF